MEFIDKIYYINLETRKDRNLEIQNELKLYDISENLIERFNAIYNNKGCIGCSQSHLEILKDASNKNYNNILILEDDFKFVISKETFNKNLSIFFNKYNDDFDVIMLAYNLIEGKDKEKDNLIGYVKKARTSSGYIVNKRILSNLINTMEDGLKKLKETGEHWNYSIDTNWFNLQKEKNWYYFKERVGIQRPSYSNCSYRFENYGC